MGGTTKTEPTRVTVNDAMGRLEREENVVFVDCRNPTAWGESRAKLPGAIRVPADDVNRHLAEIPRGRTIVTYCT